MRNGAEVRNSIAEMQSASSHVGPVTIIPIRWLEAE